MSLAPDPQPNWIFAIATVVWAIAVGLVVRLLIAVLGQALGGQAFLHWLESTPTGLSIVAATIQLSLLVLVGMRASVVPHLRDGAVAALRSRKSYGLASLLFIIGLGPFANLCGMSVAKLTHADLESMKYVGELIRRASVGEFILLGLVLTVLPAVVEESLFRGLVFRSLEKYGVWVAIVLQALAFGLFHMDVAQGVTTALLGLGFGYIAYATGSLAGSMVAHGGYNLMVLLSQRWLPQGDGPLTWQWLELIVGFVFAAGAVGFLHVRRQRA